MTEPSTPPKKKARSHNQKFRAEYSQKYPCFTSSKVGDTYAFCRVCKTDILVSHAGLGDLHRHVGRKKHVDLAKLIDTSSQKKISSLFITPKDEETVIGSEIIFTKFLIENNLPLSVSDSAGKMFKRMFPDSDIAKKYGCARTKSTAIVKCLADNDARQITEQIKSAPFSIATDGSNDYGDIKLYPIIVKYFDEKLEKIITTMLTLTECKDRSTGENIFNLLDKELQTRGIPWSNCICLAADNAAVMSGHKKGVKAFVKAANEDVYFLGCPCHLLHLAAEKGANTLPAAIEDLLISVYYYLEKSSKRQKELRDLQVLHDVGVRKILKHVSTRWLSLGVCLNRVLNQWTPLQQFFKEEKKGKTSACKQTTSNKSETMKAKKDQSSKMSETCEKKADQKTTKPNDKTMSKTTKEAHVKEFDVAKNKKDNPEKSKTSRKPAPQKTDKPKADTSKMKSSSKQSAGEQKAEKIYKSLTSNTFKLYCLFLKNVLPLFDHANQLLQNEKPCIQILHAVLDRLFRNLLTRFVKPEAIVSAKSSTSVKFQLRENQKDDDKLTVGAETRVFIESHPHLDLHSFYQAVRLYFLTICNYMSKNFPFEDEVLLNAAVADVSRRSEMDFNSLSFFVKRFGAISKSLHPGTLDELEGEFLEYQIQDLPADVMETDRTDTAWVLIGKILDPATGTKKYGLLSKVMLSILVIFHSNTDCERIFSFVTKSKTKFRPNMTTPTLSALVTHKVSMLSHGEKAFSAEIPKQVLREAKSATYSMLSK